MLQLSTRLVKCLNSLQTGKQSKSSVKSRLLRSPLICFNSLQTGKTIQSGEHAAVVHNTKVSIPFKRESRSKALRWVRKCLGLEFQFPSNGKAYLEKPSAISHQQRGLLLIKNLLLLTAESRQPKAITLFPSNGKTYQKEN